jgi:hypothetical protein
MADVKCPKCAVDNPAGAAKCRGCGGELPAGAGPKPSQESMYGFDVTAKPPIAWGWAGLGVLGILATQIVLSLTVTPVLFRAFMTGKTPNHVAFWVLVLALSAVVYFAAGFVIGRYSKGYLVREPAIAAVGAALVNWLLDKLVLKSSGAGVGMLLVAILLCAGLGYAGGLVGEQVQQKAREQRKAAAGR